MIFSVKHNVSHNVKIVFGGNGLSVCNLLFDFINTGQIFGDKSLIFGFDCLFQDRSESESSL